MMHVTLILWSVFAVWRWGNWKHWKQYHATMLFMALSSAMYDVLVNDGDFYLWRYIGNRYVSEEMASLMYTVIAFPANALLFLSNYPEEKWKQLLHIFKYAAIYVVLEIIGLHYGLISHAHSWNMWWSAFFDLTLFSILRLHHTRPLLAYAVSFVVATYLMIHFHVSLWDGE
ncbi:CBO0543 family protein [Brevibacillus brevis]|uniref:CBO0543 family protein n=1 Tax=Brevibacillus brevis TaxID=1393 RepID=A0ABY9T4J5_BREBE|nr:CBO0543 family protein [Brevibacillus brevis]WNC13318.1 CBO0543 family protein [Brevibacillus brevis]